MKTKFCGRVSQSIVLTVGLTCGAALLQAQTAPPTASKPARVRPHLEGFELSPKSGKSANQIGGASRDIGTPKLLAPNLGKAFTTNPEFHWASGDAGEKVTFRLTSMEGQTIYEATTTAEQFRYPGDAPALMPGMSYRWTIIPENDVLGGAPVPVTFVVLSGAEREEIQKELMVTSDPSAIAQVYVKHRTWYDAVQIYSDLIARMPANEEAHAGRAVLYDQIPVTKSLAEADWRMVH